jgi:hypothetical protein
MSCPDHLTVSFSLEFSHSVRRGGYGNITPGELPHSEGPVGPHGFSHPHATHDHLAVSRGRGGTGNIVTMA